MADPDFEPLNIICVFTPPAEGDVDVKQIQDDQPQEEQDNQDDPEGKKAALKAILADYNQRYGTHHTLSEFDPYHQDVQKRIKDQQWPDADFAAVLGQLGCGVSGYGSALFDDFVDASCGNTQSNRQCVAAQSEWHQVVFAQYFAGMNGTPTTYRMCLDFSSTGSRRSRH